MATETLTHFDPFAMVLPEGTATRDPTTKAMAINLTGLPTAASVEAAQATAIQALDETKIVRAWVVITDIVAPADVIQVPVPGPCTLTFMRFSASVTPATGDLTISAEQGGVGYTDGTATLTTFNPAGATADASPVDANFGDGACVELLVGGTNTAAGTAVVMLVFTLT